MDRNKLIKVGLAALVLALNVGFVYMYWSRYSKKAPVPRISPFVESSKRGFDAFNKKDFDQAIAAWDEAIRIDPAHSEVHRWRGDALLNKREHDSALYEYDEALRLDAKNGMAYSGRGIALYKKGELDQSIAAFDEAIRVEPKVAEVPLYKTYRDIAKRAVFNAENQRFVEEAKRGGDAFKNKDYDQAIAAWSKAFELNPNHSEVHRWQGDALKNKQEFGKALAEYDEAIRLDDKNGMAYFCRGIVFAQINEFKKALASYNQAIQLDSTIANRPDYKRHRVTAEMFGAIIPGSPKN